MALRVSQQYIEVLGKYNPVCEEVLTDSLNLTSVSTVANIHSKILIDTLTFTDWVNFPLHISILDTMSLSDLAERAMYIHLLESLSFNEVLLDLAVYGDFIPLGDSLGLIDTLVFDANKFKHLLDTMSITDANTYRLSVMNELLQQNLWLASLVDAHWPRYATASDTLSLVDKAGIGKEVSIIQTLGLTSTAFHRKSFADTLNLVQTVLQGKGKTLADVLTLTQTHQVRLACLRSIVQTLGLGHALTYFLLNPCTNKEFIPFGGETSFDSSPLITITQPQDDPTQVRFRLAFPAEVPLEFVNIRAPDPGNIDRLAFNRVNRETFGGSLVVYADPTWPKIQTVHVSFSGLDKDTIEDVQNFFNLHLGQEISIIDWEGREWFAIITTPSEQGTQNNTDNWSISFEFEGILVDGYLAGNSVTLDDTLDIEQHLQRSWSDTLDFNSTGSWNIWRSCITSDTITLIDLADYSILPP